MSGGAGSPELVGQTSVRGWEGHLGTMLSLTHRGTPQLEMGRARKISNPRWQKNLSLGRLRQVWNRVCHLQGVERKKNG
jgi:hypothetical protein